MPRILACVLTVLCLLFPSAGYADLLIEEGKLTFEAHAGETIVDSFMVHNTSNQTRDVKVYWQDFRYKPPFDGSKELFPPGTLENSLTQFSSFSPRAFVLAPYAKKEISYTIAVPEDAVGGYYGVLFFEPGEEAAKGNVGLSIVTRIGSLFFLEVGQKEKTAVIKDVRAVKEGFAGTFANQGNIIMIPDGTFYIMNEEGIVQERGEIEKFYLPPEKEVGFTVKLAKKLGIGTYTAIINFDLKDGDGAIKEIDFSLGRDNTINILALRD